MQQDKFNIAIANLNYKPAGSSFLKEHIWSHLMPELAPFHKATVEFMADLMGHPLLQTAYGCYLVHPMHSETMLLTFGDETIITMEIVDGGPEYPFLEHPQVDVEEDYLVQYQRFADHIKNVMYAQNGQEFVSQTITYRARHLLKTLVDLRQNYDSHVVAYREDNRDIFQLSIYVTTNQGIRFTLRGPQTEQ